MTEYTINVDVSDLVRTRGKTGIQRVLREITARLLQQGPQNFSVRILRFNYQHHYFETIEHDDAVHLMFSDDVVPVTGIVRIEDLGANDIFYDIDAVWSSPLKRAYLYKRLKQQSVTIFATLFDFVPVKFPAFCYKNTLRNWPPYIAAVYAYADLVFIDSRSAERDFNDYKKQFGVTRRIPTVVTKLGGDFTVTAAPTERELELTARFLNEPYLLFVGSIEPRKMHTVALDAIDEIIKSRPDVHLVIAGKMGWNSNETMHRLLHHPLYARRVHWVNTPSDELLKVLYERSTIALYLSHHEGFGLPVVESLSHGKITITSKNSSIYEVGHAYADYTHFNSGAEVAETALGYLNSPKAFKIRTEQIINEFHPYPWDLVYSTIRQVFENLDTAQSVLERERPSDLQFVFISNVPESLERTIGLLDDRAAFVSEYVVVAPAAMRAEIEGISSRHPIRVIDEESMLGDRLEEFRAAEHQGRNWILRSLLPYQDGINEEFVMLDDDNQPLVDIDISTFINPDHSYNAYYFYDLTEWPHRVTNYDMGQHETRNVLDRAGLELLSYSSHQPQILNKTLLREVVEYFALIAPGAVLDEWSAYFNYAITRYPTLFTKRVYETMNWPATSTTWSRQYSPDRYTFENYYPSLYTDGGLFGELEPTSPTEDKVAVATAEGLPADATAALIAEWNPTVSALNLAHGALTFVSDDTTLMVSGVPHVIVSKLGAPARLKLTFSILENKSTDHVQFCYRIRNKKFSSGLGLEFETEAKIGSGAKSGMIEMPFHHGDLGAGTYELEFFMTVGAKAIFPTKAKYRSKLVVVDTAESLASSLKGV